MDAVRAPKSTARIAVRSSRQRNTIRRCGVRLWKPIRQPLCRVVKRRRSRPDRFQIVSRFPIAADKVLHPRDLAAPISRALPDFETTVSWPKSGFML